jgi:hypothetical protein
MDGPRRRWRANVYRGDFRLCGRSIPEGVPARGLSASADSGIVRDQTKSLGLVVAMVSPPGLHIALIGTRSEIPCQSLGTVVSTHKTMLEAFKGNEAFQVRMRQAGVTSHVRTRIVTLKAPLRAGQSVKPADLA